MRKRTAWMLVATAFGLGLMIVVGQSILAQGNEDEDDNIPFHLNGHAWRSKKAFIESGARCATRNVDEIEGEEVEKAIRKAANERGGSGGQRTSGSPETALFAAATINVRVHVITNVAGNGNLTNEQINSQISVLNSTYPSSSFSFVLASVDRTANNSWYTAGPGSAAEAAMKNS